MPGQQGKSEKQTNQQRRDTSDAICAYACVQLRLQTFSSFKGAVPFKLRLSASEWRFALTSFAVKVALFWLLELAFCQWAPERQICHLVEKGFCPA